MRVLKITERAGEAKLKIFVSLDKPIRVNRPCAIRMRYLAKIVQTYCPATCFRVPDYYIKIFPGIRIVSGAFKSPKLIGPALARLDMLDQFNNFKSRKEVMLNGNL
jgi:hypothetical protein